MPPTELILVRFSGEISTKSRQTRLRFVRRLAAAAEDALLSADIPFRLERRWSRLYVEAERPGAVEALQRVFGVQSVSPAVRRPWSSLEELVAAGRDLFADKVAGKRFAVRARRAEEAQRLAFASPDVERALGAALLPAAAGVDLSHPEVKVQVEIHPGEAVFFSEVAPGPGGLPAGVEGRALALLSGGFDSAVAAWLMLRRGVALDYVFFDLGGEPHRAGAQRVLDILARRWSSGDWPRLHAIDLKPLVARLQERVRPRYWQLGLKWLMYRASSALASELELPFLVTGESIGQVSSQTLPNLAALEGAATVPVLRPLAGANKEEIVARAREIDTWEASAAVEEYCALHPRHAMTAARREELAEELRALSPLPLAELLAARRTTELRARRPGPEGSLALPGDELPAGAVLLDLRPREDFRRWHPGEALWLEFFDALKAYPRFDRGRPYVLYCEVGFKSAHLAELMREAGFTAYHVPGGVAALRRLQPAPPAAAEVAP